MLSGEFTSLEEEMEDADSAATMDFTANEPE
jgi:hypothetical protein